MLPNVLLLVSCMIFMFLACIANLRENFKRKFLVKFEIVNICTAASTTRVHHPIDECMLCFIAILHIQKFPTKRFNMLPNGDKQSWDNLWL